MKKIEVTNANGEHETFRLKYHKERGEEAISEIQGFTQDWKIGFTRERSPFQQGSTTVALRGQERPLSFVIGISTRNNVELDRRVQEIVRFFNPYLGPVRVTYDGGNRRRSINAFYEEHTLIEDETTVGFGNLHISLIADDALFEDEKEQIIHLGSSDDTFTIPFTVPFTLGVTASLTEINNTGDFSYPVELIFHGPLENPELVREVYNQDGDIIRTDYLKFVGLEIEDFYSIRINTHRGDEEATLIHPDGEEENINRYLSSDSSYWQIYTGRNVVRFTSTTGNPATELRFRQRYITA